MFEIFFRCLGVLALASGVAWAAFGVSWWAPITEADTGRAIMLTVLHCVAIFTGLVPPPRGEW